MIRKYGTKIAIIAILVMVGNLGAVDLKGRFGMGIGWRNSLSTTTNAVPSLPNLLFMRIPLSNTTILEPSFSIVTQRSEVELRQNTQTVVYSLNNNLSSFSVLVDILFKGNSKTNFYGKVGAGFDHSSAQYTTPTSLVVTPDTVFYDLSDFQISSQSATAFGLLVGVGIEGFLSKNVSLVINTLSQIGLSFSKTSQQAVQKTTGNYFSFGNQILSFALTIYY